MKTLKIVLTVILTIIIIAAGFVAEVFTVINVSLLNPWFYKTALAKAGFYDNVRMIMLNDIHNSITSNSEIPDSLKDDVYSVSENVFSKEKFDEQLGNVFSGIISYVLYDKGDAEFPFNTWLNDFDAEITSSGITTAIAESKITSGEISEDEKEYYVSQYSLLLKSIYTNNITVVSSFTGGTNSFSEMLKAYFPTDDIMQRLEQRFWQFRTWVKWSRYAIFISLGVLAVMIALLFIVWRKNSGFVWKHLGVVLIVNSAVIIISGAVIMMATTIADILNKLPEIIAPYSEILQTALSPLGFIFLGSGILVLVIGIAMSVIGGALIRKNIETETIEEADTIDTEIKEIDYTEDSKEDTSEDMKD